MLQHWLLAGAHCWERTGGHDVCLGRNLARLAREKRTQESRPALLGLTAGESARQRQRNIMFHAALLHSACRGLVWSMLCQFADSRKNEVFRCEIQNKTNQDRNFPLAQNALSLITKEIFPRGLRLAWYIAAKWPGNSTWFPSWRGEGNIAGALRHGIRIARERRSLSRNMSHHDTPRWAQSRIWHA